MCAVTVVGPTEKKAGKPGDWDCGKCTAANFARRKMCYQCGGPKPNLAATDGQAAVKQQSGQGGAQQQQQAVQMKAGEETWDGKKACDCRRLPHTRILRCNETPACSGRSQAFRFENAKRAQPQLLLLTAHRSLQHEERGFCRLSAELGRTTYLDHAS